MNLSTARLAKGLEVSVGARNLFYQRKWHPGSDINWQGALAQDGLSVQFALRYRF